MELAQETVQAVAKQGGFKAWTSSRQQRRAAERIAENLRRNATEHERQQRAAVIPSGPAQAQTLPVQA